MKGLGNQRVSLTLAILWTTAAVALEPVPLTHMQFQAVNDNGEQIFSTGRVVLEGIVLNYPADLVDPTPDDTITTPFNLGGQWQIFFQGEGEDHGGTAVWIGQLYNNLPWVQPDGGYSNAEFIAELTRINSARFVPGDRIRVTGYFLSYKGKNNINEQHNKDPMYDFTIELLERGVGLPEPDVVTLEQLKDQQDRDIFDPLRLSGGEYYQGRLVKIPKVRYVDASGWGPNAQLLITDGTRTFPVKLGRGTGIYPGSNNLVEPFDVIGIMDQDSTNLKAGYRIWVPNYDGNGYVLASYEHRLADKAHLEVK
ncbi:MAG: hypothetical protein QHH07_01080 [Sedimentisphaerales bacterium]|nr:hypothetical protein [Sedimentisphaerales bacterium]